MPDQTAQVQIVISGTAVGLEEALAQAQSALKGFGTAAGVASEQAGTQLAGGEARAAREATTMAERVKVAADAVGFLGIESGESVGKVFLLRDAVGDLGKAFGGLSGAITGGIGAALAFGSIDFLKGSVEDAMDSQAAWDQLTASYAKNKEGLEAVKGSIEDNQAAWERLGVTQGQVAAMALRARQAGMDPTAILGDPNKLADTAAVLGTTIPDALNTIATQKGALSVLKKLGLSPAEIAASSRALQYMNAQQRALYVESQVEQRGGAGRGLAIAGTAQGSFAAFHAAMGDLKEEVGNALLPALTALAQAMTHVLQGLEAITKPFGGLANVLKVLLIPMLLLGIKMFLGMKGLFSGIVDLLLGRVVGSFEQTAQSAADLANAIKAIPAEVDTKAVFVPDDAKEAWIANIGRVPRGPITTTAAFDDAAALAGVATFEEALPADIPVPVVAQDALSKADVAADAAAAEGAVVRVPVVAQDAISKANVAAFAAAAEGAFIGVPVVPIDEMDPQTIIDDAGAAGAAARREGAAVDVPVTIAAMGTAAVERDVAALRAYARSHPIDIAVQADIAGVGTSRAHIAANLEEVIHDTEARIARLPRGSAVRAEAVRRVTFLQEERTRVLGEEPLGKVKGQIDAADKYAREHPVEIAVGAENVPTGRVEGQINTLDEYAQKHPVTVPVHAEGTIKVTGGEVPLTPVLASGAEAEEQRIRNQIRSGVGVVHVPVDAQNNLEGGVEKDITEAQTYANAHHVHVFVDALKEGAAWGTMGVAFSVADLVVNSKATYVQDQMPKPKGGPAPALAVSVVNTPTVNLSKANLGSIAPALVLPNVPVTGTITTKGKGQPQALPVSVVSMPDIKATAVLGGTTVPLSAKQSGHWKVDIGNFDVKAIGEMALAGVLTSLLIQGGSKLLGWLKGVLPSIRIGGGGTGLPELPPEAEGDLGKVLQFPRGGGGGGIAGDIVQGVEQDIGPAMESAAPTIEGAVALQMGEAAVAGLAQAAPELAMAAADAGGIEAAGFLEAASAGLATPLVAIILGGLTVASAAVFTHGFGLLGKDGKKEADKLKKTLDLGAMFKPIGQAIGGALGKVGSAFGSLGGMILDGIVKGIKGAAKLVVIAETIIGGIQSAIRTGIINLINGILTMFNNIFKKLSETPVVGKAFEKLRIPLIPVPHSAASSSGSHSRGAAGLTLVNPATIAALGSAAAASGLHPEHPLHPLHQAVARHLAAVRPATHPAVTAVHAPVHAPTSTTMTLNATFQISGAQDPVAIGRQIERALSDFVQGARSQRRLVG